MGGVPSRDAPGAPRIAEPPREFQPLNDRGLPELERAAQLRIRSVQATSDYISDAMPPSKSTATPDTWIQQPTDAGRSVTNTPRVAAFFDLDGTLADSNAVRSFLWLALAERGRLGRVLALARLAVPLGVCILADRLSRRLFNRMFYRLYRALPPERVRRLALPCCEATIASRIFPDMAARVEAHRAQGEDVVIVTGALDVLVAPLAERLGAAAVAATTLEERDGRFTGRPLRDAVRDGKDAALREIAAARGYDLPGCAAYADHASDLPFLLAVGRPVAARPDHRLRHEAQTRGWPVIEDAPR